MKRPVLICDLDESLCSEFSVPVRAGCELLRRLAGKIEVHYLTARSEVSRAGTLKFLKENRLPDADNLHLCPSWKSPRQHKIEVMKRLVEKGRTALSIGDSEEDEEAAQAAGVPFLKVGLERPEADWAEVARRLGAA